MRSPEEKTGRALLRKWHNADIDIRATFETSVSGECVFIAVGKIANLSDEELHVSGKGFNLVCDLRRCEFTEVASVESLQKVSPSLVGKQPETVTLVFEWNDRCVLTTPSKMPS